MKSNSLLLLLRNELLSTSGINKLKYSDDKKQRGKAIGGIIGYVIVIIMIMAYGFLTAWGYGMIGLSSITPALTALLIAAISFIFTFLKSNSYLYKFKEYDMLMSMPFEIRDIVASKFLYMYIKSLYWYLGLSFAELIGYAIWEHPGVYTYVAWIILTFILPLIPSVLASLLGVATLRIGINSRFKQFIQVFLSFLIILFSFSLRFIIEGIAKNGEVEDVLANLADGTQNVAGYYFPAMWFSKAVTGENILLGILLILLSVAISYGFFVFVAKSYRQMNSRLSVGVTKKKQTTRTYKKRSIIVSVAIKEWKRFTGSSLYMTNCGFGVVMALILGIVGLFVKADAIVATITGEAPLETYRCIAALPLIAFFFAGMAPTTCCSLSLEGKNFWIVSSLPISKRDLYLGKMLMNMLLSVPFMLLASLGLCICFDAGLVNTLLALLLSVILCAYATSFGMLSGIKFVKLEWENEIEVIKQGAALAVFLIPNMILTMGLCVGAVALTFIMPATLILLILNLIYLVITCICCIPIMARKN